MYGVTIAISAWFSGVLAEAYGVKRTMFAGLVLYLLGTCGFVGLSLPGLHYPLMLVTYALRGFGYPLFAYSFLVWIAYAAPKDGLGKAVVNTLWTSVFWALLGAFFALVMNKSQKRLVVAGGTREKMKELLKGITIMKEEPKVLLGGALLAGYVPLSALMPSLVKKDKGAAVSVLNLGAGLPVFVGPAIVGVFYRLVGGEGVVWILAGLYLFGAFLTKFITLPGNAKTV